MIDHTLRQARWLALPLICLGLAGCNSSSSSSAGNSALNVFMFQSTKPPPADQLPKDDDQNDQLVCPEVIISDGGAAIRAQSGQDSSGLRYQVSITNVARECTGTGKGTFRLKVGVEGRVLLGMAGSSGTYGATLTTTVMRGTTVLAKRSAHVGATVPSGQGGADFTYVEDGIMVPAGSGDVDIFVSLGGGGAAAPARKRRR
uniref:Lipoprotein n=1 Tax=Bosea sp. NBC_00436 TaxID=2969620 RepID=A0A9E7ZX35_9HYPH